MKKKTAVIFVLIIGLLFGCAMANAQYLDKDALKYPERPGKIDAYLFSRSIPEHMTIGESYKVPVFVKNTGKSPAYFLVVLTAPSEFIYPEFDTEIIELNNGESGRVEFLMTPIKPHIGELNITAELYLLIPLLIEIDSTSDSVFLIKRNFSTEDITAVGIIVMLLTLCAAALITIKKKK